MSTTFTVTVRGEGTNIAGFARTISQSKTYTRAEIIDFVVSHSGYMYGEKAAETVSAMSNAELAEEINLNFDIEEDITEGEMLSGTEFDVVIN